MSNQPFLTFHSRLLLGLKPNFRTRELLAESLSVNCLDLVSTTNFLAVFPEVRFFLGYGIVIAFSHLLISLPIYWLTFQHTPYHFCFPNKMNRDNVI